MAPSSNRRSGFSRRAQYTTFLGYIAGVVAALVGAGLLVVSLVDPSAFPAVRGFAADAVAPVGEASARARAAGYQAYQVVTGYVFAGIRQARLERELRIAKVRLAEARATDAENRRLKALLGLASQTPRPVAVTRLIAASAASTRRFATIGAGRANGVAPGMPVRSPLGLVGRVLEVGRVSARVLLITDGESLVPVRRASDGIAAFAQGRGDGTLQLRLISLGINPLRRGDVFVTSGAGGLYRPGIAVATVATVARDGAIAQVLSDPAVSEYVLVDPVWAPEARAGAGAPDAGLVAPPPAPAAGLHAR